MFSKKKLNLFLTFNIFTILNMRGGSIIDLNIVLSIHCWKHCKTSTFMYSSRMRTDRGRQPPGRILPLGRHPLYKHPSWQTSPGQTPLGIHPPADTLCQTPPGQTSSEGRYLPPPERHVHIKVHAGINTHSWTDRCL